MNGAAKRKGEESKSPGNAAVPLPENNANADKKNDKRRSSCYDSKILSDEKGKEKETEEKDKKDFRQDQAEPGVSAPVAAQSPPAADPQPTEPGQSEETKEKEKETAEEEKRDAAPEPDEEEHSSPCGRVSISPVTFLG